MTYEYHKQEAGKEVVITLHGTGADMHDLDTLASMINSEATIIGLQGDVTERGMLRWFKRHRPGVFDEKDLQARAKNLAEWLPELAKKEDFSLEQALFVGFSNGANMIAALLQLHPGIIKKAALLHGQIPLPQQSFPQQDAHVFVSAGRTDHMIPYSESKKLAEQLQQAGVDIEFFVHEHGHTITNEEVEAIKNYFC
ncbi:MAG: alpha/beta hydrolase [Candidatus Woesearchaeota archaeon]